MPKKSFSWIRRSLPIAAATLAAFCLVATPAAAQDVPWGHKSDSKKAQKKKPKKAAKKKPAKKTAAKKTAAKKKPAKKTAAKKTAAKKKPAKKTAAQTAAAKRAAKAAAQKAAAEKAAAEKAAAKTAPASAEPKAKLVKVDLVDHFKSELAPHGKWVQDATHGDVWIPNPATVGKNWAPYRDHGHWAVTDKGEWAWVSDMAWGKIPFHYGRWFWTKDKSWMWKPGTEHAPAWVVWRVADGKRKFVGWAPMAPEVDAASKTDAPAKAKAKGKNKAKPAAKKTVLPFYFAPTRYLFSPHIDKFIIANKRLGKKMYDQSHIFSGHSVPATTVPKVSPRLTKKGAKVSTPTAKVARSGLQAASPSFTDVTVPAYAMPKTKLASTHESVAPIAGVSQEDADSAPETSRFATPPPGEDDASEGRKTKRRVTRPYKKRRRARRARKAYRKRTRRGWKKGKPRYRCWWTNTRPRIWRCGY